MPIIYKFFVTVLVGSYLCKIEAENTIRLKLRKVYIEHLAPIHLPKNVFLLGAGSKILKIRGLRCVTYDNLYVWICSKVLLAKAKNSFPDFKSRVKCTPNMHFFVVFGGHNSFPLTEMDFT